MNAMLSLQDRIILRVNKIILEGVKMANKNTNTTIRKNNKNRRYIVENASLGKLIVAIESEHGISIISGSGWLDMNIKEAIDTLIDYLNKEQKERTK